MSVSIAIFVALQGGKVYLACRSLDRARQAVKDIQKSTRVPESQLCVIHLKLSSLQSVRDFATEFHLSQYLSYLSTELFSLLHFLYFACFYARANRALYYCDVYYVVFVNIMIRTTTNLIHKLSP